MLSNRNHTKSHLLPRLVENLNKHGYVEMNKVLMVSLLLLSVTIVKLIIMLSNCNQTKSHLLPRLRISINMDMWK